MNNKSQDFNDLMIEHENELVEKGRANARGQLRDSMEMFRAHPLRVARRLPDGGVL